MPIALGAGGICGERDEYLLEMTAFFPRRLDVLALCVFVLDCMSPLRAQEPPVSISPEARLALASMVKTYRGLKALSQETTFFGDPGGFVRMESARLLFAKPNRLSLEVIQKPSGSLQAQISRFVCDGKSLYIHQAPQTYFRREQAPKRAEDFLMLGVTIEMAAIAGIDPWTDFIARSKTVSLSPGPRTDGVETDEVTFDLSAPKNQTYLRVHLGREDRLVRRFEYYDEILVPLKPDGEPEVKIPPLNYGYDNRITLKPNLSDDAFRWAPPPGILELRSSNFLGKNGKGPSGSIYRVDSKGNAQPTRAMSYKDLVEEARRQSKQRP